MRVHDHLLQGLHDAEETSNDAHQLKNQARGTALERREIFIESAKQLAEQDPGLWEKIQYATQKSAEWSEGRKNRLTASSFGAVLGLLDKFDEDSIGNLWEEKIGFRKPFAGCCICNAIYTTIFQPAGPCATAESL